MQKILVKFNLKMLDANTFVKVDVQILKVALSTDGKALLQEAKLSGTYGEYNKYLKKKNFIYNAG